VKERDNIKHERNEKNEESGVDSKNYLMYTFTFERGRKYYWYIW